MVYAITNTAAAATNAAAGDGGVVVADIYLCSKLMSCAIFKEDKLKSNREREISLVLSLCLNPYS